MVPGEEKCPDYRGVRISGVEKYTYMYTVLGEEESVLIIEVSIFQGWKSTHTCIRYLGRKKVS